MIFTPAFLKIVADKALLFTSAACQAQSLKAKMTVSWKDEGALKRIVVNVPHYWAIYYHDGRDAIDMRQSDRPNGWMVWFKNPSQDPRLAAGYPVKFEEVKYLRGNLRIDPEEFQELIETEQIYVRKWVGPAPAHPFSEDAYRRWVPWLYDQFRKKAEDEANAIMGLLKEVAL